MFSRQHWTVRILMILAFTAIMICAAFVIRLAVSELPSRITEVVAVAIICLSGGFLLGQRDLRKHIERHGCDPSELIDGNPMDDLFDPGPDKTKFPPGKDPRRVHLVCPCNFARKAQLDDEAELALILDAAENPDRYRHL